MAPLASDAIDPVFASRVGPSPTLERDEIHIWRTALVDHRGDTEVFARVLSSEERVRADRYVFEKDRERFILGRGFLRAMLGRYVGSPAEEIRFSYGANGKPYLGATPGANELEFNFSHAHGQALLAVRRGHSVGIDLELARPFAEVEGIAERFFSEPEIAALRDVAEARRGAAFVRVWARKEAYVKARGGGLSIPLGQFSVLSGWTEPAAPVRFMPGASDSGKRWFVADVVAPPGFAAAVAYEGAEPRVRLVCWQA
jgi:4'-phosphopantetheinyl transferase